MAERSSTGLLMMMLDPSPAIAMTLPAEVREKLAELELELSEGESLVSHLHATCRVLEIRLVSDFLCKGFTHYYERRLLTYP